MVNDLNVNTDDIYVCLSDTTRVLFINVHVTLLLIWIKTGYDIF